MVVRISRASLLRQMRAHFPKRWEVAHMESRIEGKKAIGTIKIHCQEDNKVFLSDFSASIDEKGRVAELTLDGVNIGKFVGSLHQGR